MRGLSPEFMEALDKGGKLNQILTLIQSDRTLELDIRDNEAYIFYRGAALYIIKQQNGGFVFENAYLDSIGNPIRGTDKLFTGGMWGEKAISLYGDKQYIEAIPYIKSVIDNHLCVIGGNDEKEFQQLIVRVNNQISVKSPPKNSSISRSTDYFFVGFEYELFGTRSKGAIDLVAVQCCKQHRSKGTGRLALVEVKLGTDSFKGESGIADHLEDIKLFFSDDRRVKKAKDEVVKVFRQKHSFGLIDCVHAVKEISDELPEFILVLADATSNGKELEDVLTPYRDISYGNFELKIALASAMGYAMYANRMLSVDDFLNRHT